MQFTKDVGTRLLVSAVKRHAPIAASKNGGVTQPVIGMEIGCFEGRTTLSLLQLTSDVAGRVICVDPFLDRYLPETTPYDDRWRYFEGQYGRFTNNTKDHTDRLVVHRGFSQDVLPTLRPEYEGKLSYIVVDGDHRTEAVYRDAVLGFPLLRIGGVMVFDDYGWGKNLSSEFDCKAGIDRFAREYQHSIRIVQRNYLLVARRVK